MSYPTPRPFVVVAGNRTGATFLCHCLSNHPQVFCHRGEVMHQKDVWRRRFPKMRPDLLLDTILHQTGYVASGCKLLQKQMLSPLIWSYLDESRVPVLFLTRWNLLGQAVSLWIVRNQVTGHPLHSMKANEGKVSKVTIAPEELLIYCEGLANLEARARRQIKRSKLPVLFLTYEDVAGLKVPTRIGKMICAFLGVRVRTLSSGVRKIHSADLKDVLANYDEVYTEFLGSKFASRIG